MNGEIILGAYVRCSFPDSSDVKKASQRESRIWLIKHQKVFPYSILQQTAVVLVIWKKRGGKVLASLSHVSSFRAGQRCCAGMWGGNPHQAEASCDALQEWQCEMTRFAVLAKQSINLLSTAGFNKFLLQLFRSQSSCCHYWGLKDAAQELTGLQDAVAFPWQWWQQLSTWLVPQDREATAMIFACGEGCAEQPGYRSVPVSFILVSPPP